MSATIVRTGFSLLALTAPLLTLASPEPAAPSPWVITQHITAPVDNVPNADRIELGRRLFFDPRLSDKGTLSCATCHNPALGWSDGLERAVGRDMKQLGRSTPTIINVAYNKLQMWDGRKPTLEAQALGPFLSPDEQNLTLETLESKVRSIPGYVILFERAYPGEEMNAATVAKAIAAFERTVISADSPFDRWQQGDTQAVSASARSGFALFTGEARCNLCHLPPNFTDDGFHNIGLAGNGGTEDLGRYAHRKVAVLKGAFKTPTLRDIALTAPYMHNGQYRTLEEVIDHYIRGGDRKDNLSKNLQPLLLDANEKADLIAFMNSLTGTHDPVQIPRLPQ
jgi:cytochrome c peroxidase